MIPRIDEPQVGYYQVKLVKNGPYVPVIVWDNVTEKDEAGDYQEDQGLTCRINGELVNVYEQWVYFANNEITKAEYDFMCADAEHAREWRPDDPKSQPRKAIDLSTQKPIF